MSKSPWPFTLELSVPDLTAAEELLPYVLLYGCTEELAALCTFVPAGLHVAITDIGLSLRTAQEFYDGHVRTLKKLLTMPEAALSAIKAISDTAIGEAKQVLATLNLALPATPSSSVVAPPQVSRITVVIPSFRAGRQLHAYAERYGSDEALNAALFADPRLTQPIEDLDLTTRPYNCLKREEIHLIGDLVGYEARDLCDIRNFQDKLLREVQEKLAKFGLSLKACTCLVCTNQPGARARVCKYAEPAGN